MYITLSKLSLHPWCTMYVLQYFCMWQFIYILLDCFAISIFVLLDMQDKTLSLRGWRGMKFTGCVVCCNLTKFLCTPLYAIKVFFKAPAEYLSMVNNLEWRKVFISPPPHPCCSHTKNSNLVQNFNSHFYTAASLLLCSYRVCSSRACMYRSFSVGWKTVLYILFGGVFIWPKWWEIYIFQGTCEGRIKIFI
jgi:hypothetical protein